jgi:ribonuclease Z
LKRNAVLALVGLALAGAIGAAWVFRGELATRLVERTASQVVSRNLIAELPDGLHAIFCGTGTPLPDRARAGPCLAVVAGDQIFVFDAGEGASETLTLLGVNPGNIDTVFLTHLHSDHFDGLAPLALQHWANVSATEPLHLVGPAGVSRVAAGLNEAYTIDAGYRTAHHGPEVMPPSGFGLRAEEFAVPEGEQAIVLRDAGGVRIMAFPVAHAPTDAVGYRIEYGGRSIVVSGDTARSESLAHNARGSDLLVHEAISTRLNGIMQNAANGAGRTNIGAIFHDILDYHTSPEDAGAVAQEAGVGALAITHMLPQTPMPGLAHTFETDARKTYSGRIMVMRDGDVISLPSAGGMHRRNELPF